ncbi:MAG: TIGR01777 family oxidoreductase [Thermoanaerobaculia bacterium]|nr:TIGR01777 family oxidoreductase [Thermoanaerobaculia bacterium]
MRVAISGSSGLIGSALTRALEDRGDEVVALVRSRSDDGASAALWKTDQGLLERDPVQGVDAVVHLAGAGIAEKRWTQERKKLIYSSRVEGTRHLVASLASLERPPRRFLCASAIGFYGDRGDERLDETSDSGAGFLAEVCRAWENESRAAEEFAERVYQIRTGIVLAADGGALAKMLTPFKLGLGGVIGSGRQYMSWIALADEVGAILHLLESDAESGPVNLTAPRPVTNREFTKALGDVLGRPTILPLPAFAVELIFGQMGEEALLGSQRVDPERLAADGYTFRYRELEATLRDILDD